MKPAVAIVVLVLVAACGGSSIDAPSIYCENTPGSGDLETDLLASWSVTQNASLTTYTFMPNGFLLSHVGTDEPGRDPVVTELTWSRASNTVTVYWPAVELKYEFSVDAAGLWRVTHNGSDQYWRRCGQPSSL